MNSPVASGPPMRRLDRPPRGTCGEEGRHEHGHQHRERQARTGQVSRAAGERPRRALPAGLPKTPSPASTIRRAASEPMISPTIQATATATITSGSITNHTDDDGRPGLERVRELAVRDDGDPDGAPDEGDAERHVCDQPATRICAASSPRTRATDPAERRLGPSARRPADAGSSRRRPRLGRSIRAASASRSAASQPPMQIQPTTPAAIATVPAIEPDGDLAERDRHEARRQDVADADRRRQDDARAARRGRRRRGPGRRQGPAPRSPARRSRPGTRPSAPIPRLTARGWASTPALGSASPGARTLSRWSAAWTSLISSP